MGLLDALFGRKPRQMPETAKPLDEASWWRVLNLVARLSQHKDEDPVELVTMVIGRRFKGKGLLPLALLAKQLMDRANTPGLHAACRLRHGHVDRDLHRSFRFWLMCQGEEVFTQALKHPDSLAPLAHRQWQADAAWEGLLKGIADYYNEPLPRRWLPEDYRSSALSDEETLRQLPQLLAQLKG